MAWFNQIIYLLQPIFDSQGRETGSFREHKVRGRLVSTSAAGGPIADTDTSSRTRLYHVRRVPGGAGTSWSARVNGDEFEIADLSPVRNRIKVSLLTLTSDAKTGDGHQEPIYEDDE